METVEDNPLLHQVSPPETIRSPSSIGTTHSTDAHLEFGSRSLHQSDFNPPHHLQESSNLPLLTEMESLEAVEKILNYTFCNKNLLKQALTHISRTDVSSFGRLAILGSEAIELELSTYMFIAYRNLNLDRPKLVKLRAANVSTEKLARAAIKHKLYQFLRTNPSLEAKILEFSEAVSKEDDDDSVASGGLVKARKVLAKLIKSLAGAIHIDMDYDLKRFWVTFKTLLEPLVTLDDLQPQPAGSGGEGVVGK